MAWESAVKPAAGGVALEVEVVPGSRESRFPAGFNPWRGRLEAKVRSPPEEGKANAELAGLVAHILDVPVSRVRVTSGAASRWKTLAVDGANRDAVLARLRPWMENPSGNP